jgi:gamma-glutamyltranspeptidase/glutathione hydrolase
MRLACADVLPWVSDIHTVDIPLRELCAPEVAAQRRQLLDRQRAAHHIAYDSSPPDGDTAHMSVVDGEGNACSSIGGLLQGTGSGLVVPGTGVALQNRAHARHLSHPALGWRRFRYRLSLLPVIDASTARQWMTDRCTLV